MHKTIRQQLEEAYKLTICTCKPGPRQFLAETWILETKAGDALFCKIIRKPRFAHRARLSLPILARMTQENIPSIAPLIPTTSQAWLDIEGGLLYLQRYIAAPQNYTYTNRAFAHLMAEIHRATLSLQPKLHPPTYTTDQATTFLTRLDALIARRDKDPALSIARSAAISQRSTYQQCATALQTHANHCAKLSPQTVLTHGDAPGNVLVATPEKLYLIDWDDIRLAPPERDLWMLHHLPELLDLYQQARPHYKPCTSAREFFTLSYFFDAATSYFDELTSNAPLNYRIRHAHSFAEIFTGWMAPHLQRAQTP